MDNPVKPKNCCLDTAKKMKIGIPPTETQETCACGTIVVIAFEPIFGIDSSEPQDWSPMKPKYYRSKIGTRKYKGERLQAIPIFDETSLGITDDNSFILETKKK